MNRRLIAILVFISLIFFPLGWIATLLSWINKEIFFSIGTIVGSIASITGLLAFIRPPLSHDDIKNLEWETVSKIAEASQEIHTLNAKKTEAQTEIEHLNQTKSELEILIKKSSLVIFYQEENKRLEKAILQKVSADSELVDDIERYNKNAILCKELEQEIAVHPNASLIYSMLISKRGRRESQFNELRQDLFDIPFFGQFIEVIYKVLRAYVNMIEITIGNKRTR